MIRKIIDGLLYDTETASSVCDVTPRSARVLPHSDFGWEDTQLYRSPNRRFFIAGEGNAASRWRQSAGQNAWSGGKGLETVTDDEAKALVAEYGSVDLYEATFGQADRA